MIDVLVWCYSTLIKCDVGVIVTELCTTTWSMFSDWWILVDVLWFYIMLDVFFLMCFRLCVLFDVLCRLMYFDWCTMIMFVWSIDACMVFIGWYFIQSIYDWYMVKLLWIDVVRTHTRMDYVSVMVDVWLVLVDVTRLNWSLLFDV